MISGISKLSWPVYTRDFRPSAVPTRIWISVTYKNILRLENKTSKNIKAQERLKYSYKIKACN